MPKPLLILFCLLSYTLFISGQTVSVKSLKETGLPDTTKLYNVLLTVNRKAAAAYLEQYLTQHSDENAKELAPIWLELAIFRAWPEDLAPSPYMKESRAAYSKYESLSAGQPDIPLIRANRLLYQSLNLSSDSSFTKAADSLLASIASRPTQGKLNQMMLADSYGEIARLYKRIGDFEESVRNFERSIVINRKLDRLQKLAYDLTNQSLVLFRIDSLDPRADKNLKESLEIYQDLDSLQAVAQVLNELGVLWDSRLKPDKSLDYFKQSLAVKYRIADLNKKEFIVVFNNIGTCYLYLGKTDSARYYYLKAVDFAIKSKRNPADYYNNLGASYGMFNEYQEALEYFQKAINCMDSTCSATDLTANPNISKVSPKLADFIAFKAHSFHRRYHIDKNPQDLIDGLNTFNSALDMMDTLRFIYSFESKPYLSSEAKIHYFSALDIALDLYSITGKMDYLDSAFTLSERNKSSILNEFLRTNQARKIMAKEAPWLATEDNIKQLINKTQSDKIKSANDPELKDSLPVIEARLSNLKDSLKSLDIEAKAKKENALYFNMVFDKHAYPPERIQEKLNDGEALLDYTVIHDKRLKLDYMVVLVLSRDTLFSFRDTLQSQFRKDIDSFRATITPYLDSQVFQDFSRLSNMMYQYFFAPIEKFKGINKLIILADEELGFLPFEVFVSDTIKPEGSDFRKLSYLNRKYQISYISSHEQLYQFRTPKSKKEKATVYAFAPFVNHGVTIDTLNLLTLDNSGKEIESVSKYYKTRIFADKKASEKSLRSAFDRNSIISLSTHGIMNLKEPMQSRLLLIPKSQDETGSLYLFEMLSLRIKSPLVILNACNTGMGKLQVGEGIMSMARGFQYAGVPTVITTLWPIDDKASAAIMNFFFENIHQGMDQGEALMKARNSYIDQSTKAKGAPFFWAGQVLIGDPGPLNIRQKTKPIIWISSLLIAVSLALFLVYNKKRR